MRENRTCGSEGGEAQSLPYPYPVTPLRAPHVEWKLSPIPIHPSSTASHGLFAQRSSAGALAFTRQARRLRTQVGTAISAGRRWWG